MSKIRGFCISFEELERVLRSACAPRMDFDDACPDIPETAEIVRLEVPLNQNAVMLFMRDESFKESKEFELVPYQILKKK